MRLKQRDIDAIKIAAADAFGTGAVVRLFGSRVDDTKRGGDIDLHVELPCEEIGARGEIPFRVALWCALDMTEVDVVVAVRGAPRRWIDDAAYRSGIVL